MRVAPLLVALALLAGCVESARPDATKLSYRTLAAGERSNITEPTRALLLDEPSWDAFWSRHAPGTPRPRVDLPRETVVAAMLGERSAGCWDVRVTDVRLVGQEAVVTVTTYDEGRSLGCATAQTSAYHLVVLDAHPQGVRFVEERATGKPPA